MPVLPTDALWQSGEFVPHLDVLIERVEGGGTVMQSYRDFGGSNRILSASIKHSGVDQAIGQGQVVLARQVGGVSLSPLVEASPLNQEGGEYTPAVDFGREIEFRVALMPPGVEPGPADWEIIFQGITDDPAFAGKTGPITVPFRDRSGPLADTYVRTGSTYGDPEDGTDAAVVMQQILDREMGAGNYSLADLTVGDRFMVRRYKPDGVTVWAALEEIAEQWGAKRLGQVKDEGTGQFNIAVISPPRDKTTPDYSIGPSTYLDATEITTGGKNLRTIVLVQALSSAGVVLKRQIPAEADVATDPGVLAYGPRLLFISESATSLINTQEEVDAMAEPIYADVSSVIIPLEMETKLAPFARVDDLVRWGANTILWDQPLDAALLTRTDEFPGPGRARTKWRCAGNPRGSILGHLRRAIAGINAAANVNRATLLDVVPNVQEDGSLLYTWTNGPYTVLNFGAARLFQGAESEAMWEEVKEFSSIGVLDTQELVLPAPPEGWITLGQIEAVNAQGQVGEVRRVRHTGSAAPYSFTVTAPESADGTTATITVVVDDPRGIIGGINVYVKEPNAAETGPHALAEAPAGTYTRAQALHPIHNVYARLEAWRTDGEPSIPLHPPLTLDSNKIPAVPDAREERTGDQARILVDSPDTDTASLWYKEVIGGVPGAEVPIAPRASDVRFGEFTVTVTASAARRFHIYAKNADGLPGEYRDFSVEPLFVRPALSANLFVTDDGTDNVYLATWEAPDATSPAEEIRVLFFEDGVLRHTSAGLDPALDPAEYEWTDAGQGDDTSDPHHMEITLSRTSDGAVLGFLLVRRVSQIPPD
jgi:hypothetical protein